MSMTLCDTTLQERVQQGLRVVAEAEKKLAELQREKEMVGCSGVIL